MTPGTSSNKTRTTIKSPVEDGVKKRIEICKLKVKKKRERVKKPKAGK